MNMAKREIKSKKCELIECLSSDSDYILQKIDSKEMLFHHEYQTLKYQQNPVKRITDLLDLILGKGEKKCEEFIHALTEVQDTYPQLKHLVPANIKSQDCQDSRTEIKETYTVEAQPQKIITPVLNESKKKIFFQKLIPAQAGQEIIPQDESDVGMFSCLMHCMRSVTFHK